MSAGVKLFNDLIIKELDGAYNALQKQIHQW